MQIRLGEPGESKHGGAGFDSERFPARAWIGAKPVESRALGVLDLTIGVAATGIDGIARGVREVSRVAAPPARAATGAAIGAAQAVAGRIPADRADQLRDSGRILRITTEAVVTDRVKALIAILVNAVLDQIDLTDLVITRVDLDRVVLHVDVDAVAARLDLLGLAEYVVDGIDLPKIVRDSTGSVASEGVRGVRMQSIEADEALAKFVDRLILRRRARRTAVEANGAEPNHTAAAPLVSGAEP